MPYNEPTNQDETIDSRDVISRIETLESDLEDAESDGNDGDAQEIQDELDKLRAFADEGCQFEDWEYGVTLVRDDYWTEYAKQYADDLGYLDKSRGWPFDHIDWDAAADHLRIDYGSVEFDGVTYWTR
jgi:hypothetical protein